MVDGRNHRIGSRGEGVDWEGLSALANRHLAKILLVLLVVLVGMLGYLNFKIGEVEDLQDHTHVCKVDDPFSPFPRVFCP